MILNRIKGLVCCLVILVAITSVSAQSDLDRLQAAVSQTTHLEIDLQELCDEIGGRVTGSKANEKSVEWAYEKLKEAGVKTWKQDFEMPVLWMEGASKFRIKGGIDFRPLAVAKYQTAPGNYVGELISVGTGSIEEITALAGSLRDNFALVETELCLDINGLFVEYTQAAQVEERLRTMGVKGIVFMASRPQKLLYRFIPSKVVENDLPQFIMAREDAKRCLRTLDNGKSLTFMTTVRADIGGSFTSQNVLAEIPGTEKSEEIILIGAHLDSWALGTGANDNGCNVTMLIDMARQMQALGLKPKRTIRFALWNGEEQGYFGSWAYTRENQSSLDQHKMAMSVDIGSGEVIGMFTNGRKDLTDMLPELLKPLAIDSSFAYINVPIIGTDNFDFLLEGVPNLVAAHKPASYGVNYHASSDTYDKVDFTSLRKNSKLIAGLLWLYANDDTDLVNLPRNTRSEIQEIFDVNDTEFSLRMFNVWGSWVNGSRGRK
jgi:hypothetical protein